MSVVVGVSAVVVPEEEIVVVPMVPAVVVVWVVAAVIVPPAATLWVVTADDFDDFSVDLMSAIPWSGRVLIIANLRPFSVAYLISFPSRTSI